MDPKSPAWRLAESGQRLTRAARDLVLGVAAPADEARIARATRLVAAALEEIGAAEPAVPAGAKLVLHQPGALQYTQGAGELAKRMLPRAPLVAVETPRHGGAPSARHELALSGRADSIATPDLIGFLSAQRKTGILEVATADETFRLELAGGDVVHAQSDRTPEGQRLGDVLVAQGAIERARLDERAEAARARAGGPRLGATLVDDGVVTREQLLAALQVQIQQLFQRLFEAQPTGFTFWSGPPVDADEAVRMNATSLLLEGARVCDERNRTAPAR